MIVPLLHVRLSLRASGFLMVGCLCVDLLVAPATRAGELLTDGGFENGAEGWDSEFTGDGEWFLGAVGALTPLSGMPTSTEGGGVGQYVVSDQNGATEITLFQPFTVAPGTSSVVASFDMFVNDWSNQTSFNRQQHARVDLLRGDVSPLSVDEGVVFNMYLGTDGGPRPNNFAHYEFDITPFVAEGGDFQIRFLTINNFNSFNQGVDNVSVYAVPSPATGCLMYVAMMVCLGLRKRGLGVLVGSLSVATSLTGGTTTAVAAPGAARA